MRFAARLARRWNNQQLIINQQQLWGDGIKT